MRGLFVKQTPEGTQRRRVGGVLLGLLLAIPALAIILPLLVRSDAAFEGLIGRSVLANAAELIPTVLFGLMLFLPAYARPVALIHDDPEPSPAKPGRFPAGHPPHLPGRRVLRLPAVSVLPAGLLLQRLSGILPEGYTQAEYARRGFFEMCALCSINLLMVIIAIGQVRREPKTPWLTKALLPVHFGLFPWCWPSAPPPKWACTLAPTD